MPSTSTPSISTKTGDCGQTSLANGERVAKDSLVMELVGTIDELSSWIGLVIVGLETDFPLYKKTLEQIQHDLYQLSAVIVRAPGIKFPSLALKNLEKKAFSLEKEMDSAWEGKFLYPGGTKLAAQLDLARTVCRRTERLYFAFEKEEKENQVNKRLAAYLNRLSDYLYLLRCYINLNQKHSEKTLSPTK